MRRSVEVEHILKEASDIARQSRHPLTTGHLLLGMLTHPNRAQQVLTDVRASADVIVDALRTVKRAGGDQLVEPDGVLDRIGDRMLESARHTDSRLASSLHLLLALTREQGSVAYRVLRHLGVAPQELRTLVLARIHGPEPRPIRAGDGGRLFAEEPDGAVAVADDPGDGGYDAGFDSGFAAEPKAEGAMSRARTPFADRPPGPAGPPSRAAAAEPALPRTGYELDPESFPLLTSLGRNLTAEAAAGRIDPVIGRDTLIEQIIDTLNKRRSNNPCLVGEPGVGKTAVVEGLARALLEHGERVPALRDRVLVGLDVGALVAGTELRGAFSRRMAKLKDEVRQAAGRVIVFIDEIHTLVGAGSGDGALDAANDLKAALARGEFPCIGATTSREYHKHIEKDPALERRFQPLVVEEPSEEETKVILKGLAPSYEAHHNVLYFPDAIDAAVRMSRRYLVERRLPAKAIDLLDTAGARVVRRAKESVEVEDVAEVVSEVTRIPLERLLMSDADRILGLREHLAKRVVGHGEVLDVLARVIQRNSAGFASKRPIGSFLFLGPTGVGKTETAKALADTLFSSAEAMTRFDMSEFMERHAVSRLLGAAPGYVGFEEAGQLTASLARRPYQIVLFDEVEKAHPDVLNVLLQVLDEGQVTDAKGQKLSFTNTVVVLTSNLGADTLEAGRRRRIGFGDEGAPDEPRFTEEDRTRLLEAARKALPPELWGRIDEKCVFRPLGRDDVARIAVLLARASSDRLRAEKKIGYEISPAVVEHLIGSGGYEPAHGARPMRGAVERLLETAVARAILKGEARPGDTVHLDMVEGELTVVRVEGASTRP